VFWILARFWKIRICVFQHGVLISMSKLLLQPGISGTLMIFDFFSALCSILIRMVFLHDSTSGYELRLLLFVDASRKYSLFWASRE
jgi:hypothetical protein